MIYLLQGERGKETGKGKTDGKDASFSVNRFSFFSAARAPMTLRDFVILIICDPVRICGVLNP